MHCPQPTLALPRYIPQNFWNNPADMLEISQLDAYEAVDLSDGM